MVDLAKDLLLAAAGSLQLHKRFLTKMATPNHQINVQLATSLNN
jgi:hypothetical protein